MRVRYLENELRPALLAMSLFGRGVSGINLLAGFVHAARELPVLTAVRPIFLNEIPEKLKFIVDLNLAYQLQW